MRLVTVYSPGFLPALKYAATVVTAGSSVLLSGGVRRWMPESAGGSGVDGGLEPGYWGPTLEQVWLLTGVVEVGPEVKSIADIDVSFADEAGAGAVLGAAAEVEGYW